MSLLYKLFGIPTTISEFIATEKNKYGGTCVKIRIDRTVKELNETSWDEYHTNVFIESLNGLRIRRISHLESFAFDVGQRERGLLAYHLKRTVDRIRNSGLEIVLYETGAPGISGETLIQNAPLEEPYTLDSLAGLG